jgi:basic membrane lipoprotein Med (substrate-binding protein (PBP1-ABC) superfamily)
MRKLMIVALAASLVLSFWMGLGISAEKPVKMHIVTCGPKTDGSWSQGLYEGYLNIKQKYPEVEIGWTDTLPFAEHVPVFESLASKGIDIIYTSEVGFEAARDLAPKYPNTWFVIINLHEEHVGVGHVSSNISSYTVRSEQGGYLSGIAAAEMSKTGKIGHIGGFSYPCVVIPAVGLAMGARSINPEVTVHTVYLGSWNDPQKGYNATKTLIDAGCDVFLAMSDDGNFGVIDACKEQKKWIIGEARDQNEYAPDLVITSRLCPHVQMVEACLLDYKAGELKGNHVRYFGLQEGYDVIAPLRNVPDSVRARIEEAKAKILSGEIKVPVIFDPEVLESYKKVQ